LIAIAVVLSVRIAGAAAKNQEQQNRPVNVLFILADQLRYDALGFVQARRPEYRGKLHVRTPHLDRLASRGVVFDTAYSQYASCGQARATLKTGCTAARHGVTHNILASEQVYRRMPIFKDRIESLQSFEQILGQHKGYTVETYGKWHVPLVWYGPPGAFRSTYYSYADGAFRFAPDMLFTPRYRDSLRHFNDSARATLHVTRDPGNPMLRNRYSDFPYTPIRLDYRRMMREGYNSSHSRRRRLADQGASSFSSSRESVDLRRREEPGRRRRTSESTGRFDDSTKDGALDSDDDSERDAKIASRPKPSAQVGTRGRDSLAANYTSTAIEGDMALRALDRLLTEAADSPFFLSVHFNSPVRFAEDTDNMNSRNCQSISPTAHLGFFPLVQHPPMVATSAYVSLSGFDEAPPCTIPGIPHTASSHASPPLSRPFPVQTATVAPCQCSLRSLTTTGIGAASCTSLPIRTTRSRTRHTGAARTTCWAKRTPIDWRSSLPCTTR
jgi:hypothetical protein